MAQNITLSDLFASLEIIDVFHTTVKQKESVQVKTTACHFLSQALLDCTVSLLGNYEKAGYNIHTNGIPW